VKKPLIILGVFALFSVIIGPWGVGSYYGPISRSQAVDSEWAQVRSVYQRRADLAPNSISTVSGSANFGKSTLTEITQVCASVGQIKKGSGKAPADPVQLSGLQQTQDGLSSALSLLLVVAENYPCLKATENFRDLQAQLEGTENRISVERRNFNDAVKSYSTTAQSFPGVLLARMFGFAPKPCFAAEAGTATPPKVRFDFGAPKPPSANS